MRVTLSITNVDTSSWTSTNGNFGKWLGIGFGYPFMAGSDIVMCNFKYFNQPTDVFTCYDMFANFQSNPIKD